MSAAGAGASPGVQPLAAEQLEQRRRCQGVVRVPLARAEASWLQCSSPAMARVQHHPSPPSPASRQEKISQ